MDIRDILKSFDQLSEATTTTDKGTVHKSEPGGYGNKHGSEDVTDQYGKPVGRMSLGKLGAQNEPKRGKGRPPNPDKAKEYDSTGLNKAMGIGKAPKPSGKPSVKHSLKEYFDQMDEALSEAGLAVQPMPATPAAKAQQQMATKPSFMIKDPANPSMPAITTQDPAVVQAAKNGTMSMQKPGAAPTTQPAPGAAPAAGAGSQVAPMAEEELDEVVRAGTRSQNYADARIVRPKTQGERDALAHNIVTGRNDKRSLPAHPNTSGSNSGFTGSAATVNTNKPTAQRFVAKPNAGDGKGMGEGVLDTVKSAVGLGNKPPATTAEKNAAFHAANKGRNMPSSGNASVDYDRFTGRDKVTEKDVGKPNNATTGFDALVRKLTPKYGKEAATKIAGAQLKKMSEAEAPQHFAQSSPLSTANRGVLEGKKGVNPFAKKDTKKKPDADGDGIPDYAEDGKGKNDTKKKGAAPKKGVNPFAKKTEKKKVKEGMEHHLQAARLEGKSHALRKMPYNCTHDNMEEARCYHDGFKEGLDECYGQMPILDRTAVDEMGQGSEVDTMASYGAAELGETHPALRQAKNVLNRQAKENPGRGFGKDNDTAKKSLTLRGLVKHGMVDQNGKFVRFPNDSDGEIDEFAFEAFDSQLKALLESEEKVSEGMTVSISKGQQGAPDSVSVSAQDGEADQLLSIIKSAGMGLFGGDEQNGYGAPQGSAGAHGGISVVDDHDGMMALMKKLSGAGGDMPSGGDYESEEGHEGHGEEGHMHGEEEPCNECGMMECGCEPSGDQQVVDEVESEDQMAYEVAENAPDSGADNTDADVAGNAATNSALATADAGEDEEEGESDEEDTTGEETDEEKVEEGIYESYANSADATFEADIDFMTKVISGGLNKQKSTGQTTVPVIAGQKNRMGVDGLGSPMKESNDLLKDYMKLSGL